MVNSLGLVPRTASNVGSGKRIVRRPIRSRRRRRKRRRAAHRHCEPPRQLRQGQRQGQVWGACRHDRHSLPRALRVIEGHRGTAWNVIPYPEPIHSSGVPVVSFGSGSISSLLRAACIQVAASTHSGFHADAGQKIGLEEYPDANKDYERQEIAHYTSGTAPGTGRFRL